MNPCVVLVNRLSSSLDIVMTINSLVRPRGGIVDLTEGETVFPDTVQATSRGGTAHVG